MASLPLWNRVDGPSSSSCSSSSSSPSPLTNVKLAPMLKRVEQPVASMTMPRKRPEFSPLFNRFSQPPFHSIHLIPIVVFFSSSDSVVRSYIQFVRKFNTEVYIFVSYDIKYFFEELFGPWFFLIRTSKSRRIQQQFFPVII